MNLLPFKPVQVAYFVSDIREAARHMAETTGAGPFFVVDRIELEWGEHRGQSCHFIHSSAYGQWGEMMLELVQQEDNGPSPFRDLYGPGQQGIHHLACFVEDLDSAIVGFEQRGLPLAARARATLGTEFAFIDATAQLGHMIELYVPDEGLTGFYDFVKTAAMDWDGRDPVRTLEPG